jgi:hypothetical protein
MPIVRIIPLLVLLLVAFMAQPAGAMLQFYKVYQAEYLDNHPDQAFAAEAKKPANRCFACHQGKSRKHHNPFGLEVKKLLDKKTDLKDVPKITAALEKVAAMKVDPNDPNSETYGDRIAAGKWPGGELEDLKQEPPGAAEDGDSSAPAM